MDPQEFKGETTVLKALFNRCQVAIAVFLASFTFHSLTGLDSIEAVDEATLYSMTRCPFWWHPSSTT